MDYAVYDTIWIHIVIFYEEFNRFESNIKTVALEIITERNNYLNQIKSLAIKISFFLSLKIMKT